MAITVQWDDPEKTIIRYTYMGQWTWAEYDEAVTQALELVKDVSSVDVIADFSQSSLLPERALQNFRNSLNKEQRVIPFEITVLVIKSEFMKRMLDMFGKLYGRGGIGMKIKSANSLEEARQIIHNRKQIPSTKP
jgi:hypothetical protein